MGKTPVLYFQAADGIIFNIQNRECSLKAQILLLSIQIHDDLETFVANHEILMSRPVGERGWWC